MRQRIRPSKILSSGGTPLLRQRIRPSKILSSKGTPLLRQRIRPSKILSSRAENQIRFGRVGEGGTPPPGDLYHTLGPSRFPIPWVGAPPMHYFFF